LNKKIIYRVKNVKTPSTNSQKTTSTTKSRGQIESKNDDEIQVTRHYHLIKQHIDKADGSPALEKPENHTPAIGHALTIPYNITEQHRNPVTIPSHDPYEVCISFLSIRHTNQFIFQPINAYYIDNMPIIISIGTYNYSPEHNKDIRTTNSSLQQ
jgi:hypothetical protein